MERGDGSNGGVNFPARSSKLARSSSSSGSGFSVQQGLNFSAVNPTFQHQPITNNPPPPPPPPQQQPNVIREQDQYMPIANVIRIMRRILPHQAKISDDAKETIQECVSEFISFVTGEANERCQREQRKTITAEDVIWAMGKLGFDDYIEPLTLYLNKYRESDSDRSALRGEPLSKRVMEYGSHMPVTIGQNHPNGMPFVGPGHTNGMPFMGPNHPNGMPFVPVYPGPVHNNPMGIDAANALFSLFRDGGGVIGHGGPANGSGVHGGGGGDGDGSGSRVANGGAGSSQNGGGNINCGPFSHYKGN